MNIDKIINKLNIELNVMQQATVDALLNGTDDIVLLSPTGSGKTLSYLLPLSQLVDASSDEVQAVVVVPGRELALQSANVLKDMGSGLRGMACYGGRPTMDEHRKLREVKPQIIFATPGRLNDHLDKLNIVADYIKYLVIDEFDKCLEMGFHDEMQSLISKLPSGVRSILLSATPAEELKDQKIINNKFTTLNFLPDEEQVPDRVHIYKVESPQKDKLETLRQLLLTFRDGSSIVFLNFRDSVERTAEFLREAGFCISYFHGGMEQKQREDALYKFSNGSANIFVSTDLASRGLDIPDIDNIVHYHIPESEDGYIHRNGLKDQKAFDYAIEVAQLNSDFRPTKDMIEAINWLVEHNINYVGQMFFETVNALQAGKDLMAVMNKNLRNDLKKDSFTKEEIGGMLGYMREITKMGKDLPKLIAELKEAEDNYVKSKLKKTIVRGGKELAASMDVHNNIDNGVGGGIDMID